jgi:nitrate reductase cytochrome c-type subunit
VRVRSLLFVLAALAAVSPALAADVTGLRGPTPLDKEPDAAPIARDINDDVRRARNYPEQPPTIPHSIAGYEISLNANKCLTCHGRQFTQSSQAPMISVTHFMDRDEQVLATVSPRRYFCNECHVPQTDAKPIVENNFVDIDTLIRNDPSKGNGPRSRK